ncbi:MAG: hypothetical protein PW786_07155 [Arachidicoccus sp.]|nr:hypothetical protein [Arachidicoccus sp.]
MEKRDKKDAMDKFLRELEDIKNSQVAVLKKIAQIEADNINAGVQILDKSLPDVHEYADKTVENITQIENDLQNFRDDFVKKNNLNAEPEVVAP